MWAKGIGEGRVELQEKTMLTKQSKRILEKVSHLAIWACKISGGPA
jgi:hypothetical protein